VDGVRDDVRGYVIEHLGDPGGVLVVDAASLVKEGIGRPESSGSTRARPGGWRTASSGCSWPTPGRRAVP
jgi:hypothetical protein